MTIPRLRYGLSAAVPADAIGAWGCRAIVTQEGHVDLVPDRIDWQGSPVILDRLDAEFPPGRLVQTLSELLASGRMNTRRRQRFTLHRSDTLVIVADTAASAGYCYLAAWATAPEAGCGSSQIQDT